MGAGASANGVCKVVVAFPRMSALVNELLGRASYKDEAGWHYWFSQRFLRNKRGLQELELNWLAVHYDDDGLVDKTFSSQVTNL